MPAFDPLSTQHHHHHEQLTYHPPRPIMATKDSKEDPVEVLFVLQPKFDLLDFAGVHEVLYWARHNKDDESTCLLFDW